MSRFTSFDNTASDSVTSATANIYKDVVSKTGSGVVDYMVIKANTNTTEVSKYACEIDGTQHDFSFDLPFSGEFGVLYNDSTKLLQSNKPIFYDTSFKIQAYFSSATTVDFKYSVMYHENG